MQKAGAHRPSVRRREVGTLSPPENEKEKIGKLRIAMTYVAAVTAIKESAEIKRRISEYTLRFMLPHSSVQKTQRIPLITVQIIISCFSAIVNAICEKSRLLIFIKLRPNGFRLLHDINKLYKENPYRDQASSSYGVFSPPSGMRNWAGCTKLKLL